ncbi:MAG: hypothetical protein KGO80_08210 [Bacteroidetes bacterium]|nr:hypothetical protein [Bacteroidota bacterium]
MEVHHKHHIPKKWSEYLTEFFMLFAAVTLGFFAENQREHYIERHREEEYMQSLLEDLIKDTLELSTATKYIDRQIAFIDTSISLLRNPRLSTEDLKRVYLFNLSSLGNRGSELSTRTSTQLKNAGGMRLVKSHEIGNLITEYWQRHEFLQKYEDIVGDLKLKARDQSYRIFDQEYYLNIEDGAGPRGVKENVKLLTTDKLTIIEYTNRLSHIKNSMLNVQRKIYTLQYTNAIKLLEKIREVYHLD